MRKRLIIFISIVQGILFLTHLFLYESVTAFWPQRFSSGAMKLIFFILSLSFVAASFLARQSAGRLARIFYSSAAVWLGFASFFFWAAWLTWIVFGLAKLTGIGWSLPHIADVWFAIAALASIAAMLNAQWIRVVELHVQLPNLHEQWRRRTAVLVSDIHLGHVRNGRFLRRIVRKIKNLDPDVVFMTGDLYDGTIADFEKLAQPWQELTSAVTVSGGRGTTDLNQPAIASAEESSKKTAIRDSRSRPMFGVHFITGNHEEFFDEGSYLAALRHAGVCVLDNEKIELNGLQLVGIHYRDAIAPGRFRTILQAARLDPNLPSILLTHAPVQLGIAEEAGISLLLCGHTHGGQFFPYNWIVRRVWGRFAHGLERLGNLQVFTTYGAGTWGPPMRLATNPELVLISFN